jgi:ribokinase
LLVSTEIPEESVAAAVEAAASSGVPCILNPAPVVPAVLRLLQNGPVLTPNATELTALVAVLDQKGPDTHADRDDFPDDLQVMKEGAGKLAGVSRAPVVVTLGARGALIVSPDRDAELLPAPPAVVRDTTGAGDIFNGVLAARLAAGDPLEVAVRTAIVAASISVAHVGARAGIPSAAHVAVGLRSS